MRRDGGIPKLSNFYLMLIKTNSQIQQLEKTHRNDINPYLPNTETLINKLIAKLINFEERIIHSITNAFFIIFYCYLKMPSHLCFRYAQVKIAWYL